MKLIDADKLSADMYHEAFVKDSDMQKWDSGCWIRYKMFENALKAQPAVEPEAISKWKKEFREYVDSLDIARDDWKGIIEYIDELPSAEPDTTTHDSIPAETGKNDGDKTSDDCISRQAESNPLEKCYTCKHVCQRVTDADTLYCRCRKGCRYEEFKPKRSNNDSGRHED